MSYEKRTFYRIFCDAPDCHDIPPESCEGETWHDDRGYADAVAMECGWQVVVGCGHSLHYCPRHIHAVCSMCHVIDVGTSEELEGKGWRDPLDVDTALCPDCANEGGRARA